MESVATQVGRVWFRFRGFSPVPFLILMIFLPPQIRWTTGGLCLLLVLGAAGEGLRIWTVGYMGGATRTRGDTVPELVHAGPLRYLRNPLYLANLVLYTVVGLLLGHPVLSGIFLLYFILQYTFIVAFEEERLRTLFGSQYENYAANVPRWIPSLDPSCEPSSHFFHPTRALRSEKSTLIAIGIFILILAFR